MSDSIGLKEIITLTAPVIKSIVDVFVTPKLEQVKQNITLQAKKHIIPNENHFREYFFRNYKKYSILNTLVFSNSQRLLRDVYVPLTLNLAQDNNIKYKIEGFPFGIVNDYNKVLITDTAGMGKSTLMKRIFLDIIDKSIGIPIFIELRRLTKEKGIIQEIYEQLNSLNKEFDEKLLLELICKGDFIFILDGYDEIPLSNREAVTSDLQLFIAKAGNNKFFLTSRPESSLSSFGEFQQFRIEPLKKKEAFELLRKYDKQGDISKLLIKKLEEEHLKNIEEFLTNPLLVSLLFTAFEHKQVIPFKKHIFYRQVYDANFESHDLTKGGSYLREKHSNLDIDDFHKVLRHIGFSCLKEQKIEYSKDEILNLISNAKKFCSGISFQESDFLKDLVTTVPLFMQDGTYYRWAHKSLQEYFAAQFIYLDAKEHQKNILFKLYESTDIDKYSNIFDLYHDIDYKTFRHTIIYSILREFKTYCETSYQNIHIDRSIRLRRQELTFWTTYFIYRGTIDNLGIVDHEKAEQLMNVIEKNEGLNINGFWALFHTHEKVNCLLTFQLYSPKHFTLVILGKRNSDLLNSYSRFQEIENLEIEIKFSIDKEYEYIKVTDDPFSILNSSAYFDDINTIIAYSRMLGIGLNYNKAMTELNNIEQEIKMETCDNFLLDGF